MGEYLFFCSAAVSLINGALLLSVNPRRAINKVFLVSSICIAIWGCSVAMAIRLGVRAPSAPSGPLIFWIRFSNASGAFIGWSVWLMRTALLADGDSFHNILKKSWLFFSISCIAAAIAFSEWYIPSESTPFNKQRGAGFIVFTLIASVSCLYMLFDASRQLKRLRGVQRIEMQFFVTGIIAACLLSITSNLFGSMEGLERLKQMSPLWILAAHAAAVWAVCYYRVFDAKQIIFSVGQRTALFGVLSLGGLGLSQFLTQFVASPSAILASSAVCCVMVVLWDGPTRRLLGLDRERILRRPRRQIIDWARQLADEKQLARKFEGLLRDWCQAENVFFISGQGSPTSSSEIAISRHWEGLVSICDEGWVTPESLQRKRSAPGTKECADFLTHHELAAILTVPKGSPVPSLIVGFGQKVSKRPYTFPDIQLLIELVELMDNILTHTRVSAHAARIEKMASAAMMSRGLAHDLKNLATPISAFLLHMEDQVKHDTPEAEVLADAKHSIKVMQDYIRESLFFSRQLVPSLTQVSSRELLSSVVRLVHDRASAAGISVLTCTVKDIQFSADFALMQRALQNLVFNGIDASSRGETIEVSAEEVDRFRLRLSVRDRGSGIDTNIRGQVFEPYFTTKDTGNGLRGLGLGLAICKKIAELHDGTIQISDNLPRGTILSIVLPLKLSIETSATGNSNKGELVCASPAEGGALN